MPDTNHTDVLNRLDYSTFMSLVGPVFEHSPWIAAEAWETRPWPSLRELHTALTSVVVHAGPERQLALIRAHPDLVGRAALAGTLTRESTEEQRAAGLDPDALLPDEIVQFQSLNAAYMERFGFPFIICAREHGKETILSSLQARVTNESAQEIDTALTEIGKIAWYRLQDIVPRIESAE